MFLYLYIYFAALMLIVFLLPCCSLLHCTVQRSMTFKLFWFNFANLYSSLVYIAFVKGRFMGTPTDPTLVAGYPPEVRRGFLFQLSLSIEYPYIYIPYAFIVSFVYLSLCTLTSYKEFTQLDLCTIMYIYYVYTSSLLLISRYVSHWPSYDKFTMTREAYIACIR